jgi:glycosyltransferase involved in cell wall biosynthesis
LIVVAISMMKDEADVCADTVGHMLTQVDHVLVADNGSTDSTRHIIERLGATVVDDPDPAYNQSAKMTRLAHLARDMFGADWLIPFDSDEIWFSPHGRLADILAGHPEYVAVAPLWDHRATGIDPPGTPVQAMRWREPGRAPLHKVACRWAPDLVIMQGNHNVIYTSTPGWPAVIEGAIQIRHFPIRSVEQMIRKVRNGAAAYKASTQPADVGLHWRQWGELSDRQLSEVFYSWYWRADPTVPHTVAGVVLPALVNDPAPCLQPTS